MGRRRTRALICARTLRQTWRTAVRRSSRDWIIIVLILSGIWLLVDGGWLRTSPSAGTYTTFGSLLGWPLILAGLFLWASSPATPLLAADPASATGPNARRVHFPVSPVEPEEDGPPRRIARKWVVVVGVVFVVLLVLGYLFAAVPLVVRDYSATVVTVPDGPGPFNNTGTAWLILPLGATLTGSWSVSAGKTAQLLVDYEAGYGNLSSSGSFHLEGASPYVYPPGTPVWVAFDVLSTSPVTVTISGTYGVPLLCL